MIFFCKFWDAAEIVNLIVDLKINVDYLFKIFWSRSFFVNLEHNFFFIITDYWYLDYRFVIFSVAKF